MVIGWCCCCTKSKRGVNALLDKRITNRSEAVRFWIINHFTTASENQARRKCLAFYSAENRSSTPITGVSTYNVTPMKAAVYFNKIQCFCFEEQRLLPSEQIDMPVFFYIDPEFETNPRMDGINNRILSYTYFKVSEE
ncbi:hypothetical protein CRYUN_Cryun11dG0111100 [Craigia yunnanensis]